MTLIETPPTRPRDPVEALLADPRDGVLAVIAGVEGPSYRPVGAIMAVFDRDERTGTLSSGCIEADIGLHAVEAREAGAPVMLRYGRGSPFADIELPCGGGLDILLLPQPDRAVLAELAERRRARAATTLEIDLPGGALRLAETGETGRTDDCLRVRFLPDLRFLVFGKGPEAVTFAGLVQSAGYPNMVLSPDAETLTDAARAGCATRHLVEQAFPADLAVDDRTAIVLFFHDHDWEPPILRGALKTDALYIGAQGSRRARDARLGTLEAMGAAPRDIARLHGPVGLIPSTRDPRTLAVSVLAEVLALAMPSAL
jgi:xanthine dehydrogenase accessory factor